MIAVLLLKAHSLNDVAVVTLRVHDAGRKVEGKALINIPLKNMSNKLKTFNFQISPGEGNSEGVSSNLEITTPFSVSIWILSSPNKMKNITINKIDRTSFMYSSIIKSTK